MGENIPAARHGAPKQLNRRLSPLLGLNLGSLLNR